MSRAQTALENIFGILPVDWRIFQKPTKFQPEDVEKAVLVSIVLHNYLRQTDYASYALLNSLIEVMTMAKLSPGNREIM